MLSGTSSSQNVPITIREDNLVEGDESFTISLSLRPVEGANINLSPGAVAVMISDNDGREYFSVVLIGSISVL